MREEDARKRGECAVREREVMREKLREYEGETREKKSLGSRALKLGHSFPSLFSNKKWAPSSWALNYP